MPISLAKLSVLSVRSSNFRSSLLRSFSPSVVVYKLANWNKIIYVYVKNIKIMGVLVRFVNILELFMISMAISVINSNYLLISFETM